MFLINFFSFCKYWSICFNASARRVCTVSSSGSDSAQFNGNHGRGKGRSNCSSNHCQCWRRIDSTRLSGLSTTRRPRLAFSQPAAPVAAHSTVVCRPRRSPHPSFSFSASISFAFARSCVSLHSASPPTWNGSAACPPWSFWPWMPRTPRSLSKT